MKRILAAAAAFLLSASLAQAQWPPVGSGTGTGSADPAQFSDPTGTLTIGGSAGAVTISADNTVVPLYAVGTSLPATCTPFATSFLDTDSTTTMAYDCIGTNTWAGRFTIADDSILVGTGTTTASKAIPDCDDSAGQHLNYDTTTNAFSCGTSSGAASFNPRTTATMFEDFITGGTTAGTVGANGLSWLAQSTGTTSNSVVGAADHPGLQRILSHATNDNSGGQIAFYNNATYQAWGTTWLSSDWTYQATIMPGSASTSMTTAAFDVGITNDTVSAATNAIRARWDSDQSDTTLVFQVCNASGATGCGAAGDSTNSKTVASTVTPSAGNWYTVKIRRAAVGVGGNPTLYFSVATGTGAFETEKTFCSSGCDDTLGTIPSAVSLFPGVSWITRNTTGVVDLDIDYMYTTVTISR